MKRLKEIREFNGNVERLWNERQLETSESTRTSLVSSGAEHDLDRLQETIDELKDKLTKTTARVNRLSGERNQLAMLLDKRDEQIQLLNRKLGEYEYVRERAEERREKLRPIRALSAGVRASIAECVSWWSGPALKPSQVRSAPGVRTPEGKNARAPLIAQEKRAAARPVVATLLFGLDRQEIERILPAIERDCASRGMMPLCLIDNDAFELLRTRMLIFEYLPPASDRDRFDRSMHWELYIQRRLALIRRKWQPVRTIAFGKVATETLAIWSSSPFEDGPLPVGISSLYGGGESQRS